MSSSTRCTYGPRIDENGRLWPRAPNDVECDGLTIYIIHDRRGCRRVCAAHANWRMGLSQARGHDAACPNRLDLVWKQITVAK